MSGRQQQKYNKVNELISTWNGFLVTAGIATIGFLLVVLPLVIISITDSRRNAEKRKDENY